MRSVLPIAVPAALFAAASCGPGGSVLGPGQAAAQTLVGNVIDEARVQPSSSS